MRVTVVSFYTSNDGWPQEGARLQAECEALGVPWHIRERPDTGAWLSNCRIKPSFILRAIDATRGPVLWLDVDTSLLAPPVGLDLGLDFMGRAKPKGNARTWHVDAMYFNATDSARDLLRLWVRYLKDHSDEHAFEQLWRSGEWRGRYGVLPPAYNDAATGFGTPSPIVLYGRSVSKRKTAEVAALRASGR